MNDVPQDGDRLIERLVSSFPEHRDADVTFVRAPGRVNLIGEHTDYNEGFVLPAAIDLEIRIALVHTAEPRIRLVRADDADVATIDIDPIPPASGGWSDYVAGTAWSLAGAGQPINGFDGVLASSLPIGSGLSSSAALETAAAWALSGPDGPSLPPLEIARLAQRAENDYVGVMCGLMDQFASGCGVADHALMLDCRSLGWRAVRIPDDIALVVIHSGVSHAHGDNAYNDRRTACERVVSAIAAEEPAVRSLRDVDTDMLARHAGRLSTTDRARAWHVVSENERVLDFVEALEAGDHASLGRLMASSQASMRDDYEITVPEIDALVGLATEVPGVIGSRMTGGGFGGCTVTLARPDAVDALRQHVLERYPGLTGSEPRIWTLRASAGAGFVSG